MKRKPGMPKLPKEKAKRKIVPIWLRRPAAEQLAAAAKKNDRTLSEWICSSLLTPAKK